MTDDLPELPDLPDEVFITDPSQFEALSSGLRMRILQVCRRPSSVREIAQLLDMPVTRLYYHTNLLEEAGFIEVVHTRKSGARLEKVYRVAARTITPGPELLDTIEDPGAAAKALAAIVIEPARAETEDALLQRFDGHDQPMALGRAIAILTPAQIEDIESRITDVIKECLRGDPDLGDPEARGYAFTYTLVPTVSG